METTKKKESGYYEISMNARYFPEMRATALAGNVIYNQLHWHSHLEIMCCVKGSFSLRTDGQILRLLPGDFAVINCDVPHEIFDGEKDGLQIIFSVDKSLLRNEEGERYQFSTVGEHAISKSSEDAVLFRQSLGKIAWMLTVDEHRMRELAGQTEKAHSHGKRQNILAENILPTEGEWYAYQREVYQCLYCMARHKISGAEKRESLAGRSFFDRCVERIHKEYAGELNAAILSKEAGVSEPTVYRLFQKNLGISLNSYIQMVRVRAVKERLGQTDEDITEIAFSCGFTSLSNFYRVFHELQGQTPKEYRRQKKKENWISGRVQENFMNLNNFQNFYELPYEREELLKFGTVTTFTGETERD